MMIMLNDIIWLAYNRVRASANARNCLWRRPRIRGDWASASLDENDRGAQVEGSWDPQLHQASDLDTTYSDTKVLLGLNAMQTDFSVTARLVGASMRWPPSET